MKKKRKILLPLTIVIFLFLIALILSIFYSNNPSFSPSISRCKSFTPTEYSNNQRGVVFVTAETGTHQAVDINKDGFTDLITANRGSDSTTVLFNNGKQNNAKLSNLGGGTRHFYKIQKLCNRQFSTRSYR